MGTMLAIHGQIINSQEPLPIPVDYDYLGETTGTAEITIPEGYDEIFVDIFDSTAGVHYNTSFLTQFDTNHRRGGYYITSQNCGTWLIHWDNSTRKAYLSTLMSVGTEHTSIGKCKWYAMKHIMQSGGGTGLTLIWSNADPSQSFASQSVTVYNATQFKAFLVVLAEANAVLTNELSGICISGNAAYIEHIWSNFHQVRTATINQSGSTITIAFSDNMRYANDGTGSGAASNASLIPKFVYGIA